jgi:hypothetical protein
MTLRITARIRRVIYAATIVMVIVVLGTPATRAFIFRDLVEFAGIGEHILRIPQRLLVHTHCFSLDRLDPTCPQCM